MTITNFYLINQLIDAGLWSWVLLIMFKRVLGSGFRLSLYLLSDLFFLVAAIIAVVMLSNQYYYYSINMASKLFTRELIWMGFHKLVTIALIIRYFKIQPDFMKIIAYEIKQIWQRE